MSAFALNRRGMLRFGLSGLGGLSLPGLLKADTQPAQPARARACIVLYMDGGPSQLDLWDLKPEAPDSIRGPFQPIATSVPGIQIGEGLPLVARQMHRVTLLRSMRHSAAIHDPAVYQMLTGWKHVSSAGGLKVEPTDDPQMGTAFGYADRSRAIMPKVIQLPETMAMNGRILPGQSGGYLGPTFDPFRVELTPAGQVHKPGMGLHEGLDRARVAEFSRLLSLINGGLCPFSDEEMNRFDKFQRQAIDIISAPSVEAAFDLDREPAAVRDRYGRHRHGQSVLLARRLVEGGARFATVYWGREPQDWADGRGEQMANNPWDTHRNHFPLVRDKLLPRADSAFSALLEDLDDRGLLDETLVVWMGDFGRTPLISKPWASRDHWPHAFSIVLAGAGLPRGAVYGATDRHAAEVTDRPVGPDDLTATIFTLLGVDPNATVPGPDGAARPLSAGQMIEI